MTDEVKNKKVETSEDTVSGPSAEILEAATEGAANESHLSSEELADTVKQAAANDKEKIAELGAQLQPELDDDGTDMLKTLSDKLQGALQIITAGSEANIPADLQNKAEQDNRFIVDQTEAIQEARDYVNRSKKSGLYNPQQIGYITQQVDEIVARYASQIEAVKTSSARPEDVADKVDVGKSSIGVSKVIIPKSETAQSNFNLEKPGFWERVRNIFGR